MAVPPDVPASIPVSCSAPSPRRHFSGGTNLSTAHRGRRWVLPGLLQRVRDAAHPGVVLLERCREIDRTEDCRNQHGSLVGAEMIFLLLWASPCQRALTLHRLQWSNQAHGLEKLCRNQHSA